MCWGGVDFTNLAAGGGIWDFFFFLLSYSYLNEFGFADTGMNNSRAALQIKNFSLVSISVPTETCLVGCLNK